MGTRNHSNSSMGAPSLAASWSHSARMASYRRLQMTARSSKVMEFVLDTARCQSS